MRAALLAVILLAGLAAGCDELMPGRSEGEKLYRKHCAKCHGNNAAGNTPRYMGNPWADLTDDHWKTGGDRTSLEGVILYGEGEMPGVELSHEEVLAIINHLRELRGETRERPGG